MQDAPKELIDILMPLCGNRYPVSDTSEIQNIIKTNGHNALLNQFKDDVFNSFDISSDYSPIKCLQYKSKLTDMQEEFYRKLPSAEEIAN